MKPRFIQENCIEGNRTDLRQANVVKKYRPDIILFELPARHGNPALSFNRYGPSEKPHREIARVKRSLANAAREYPYALSDIRVWENIERLWREGRNVLLFNIDGPDILRRNFHAAYGGLPYETLRKKLIFWVHCYLREAAMADHIRRIVKNYKGKQRPVIAVFLQSVHWRHVKFLLKNPSQREIWRYYFGRFPERGPAMDREIKKASAVHYAAWKRSALKPFSEREQKKDHRHDGDHEEL